MKKLWLAIGAALLVGVVVKQLPDLKREIKIATM